MKHQNTNDRMFEKEDNTMRSAIGGGRRPLMR